MTIELTERQSDEALALAGAAWAFLDAESRGIGSEVQSALTVFQASWGAWSSGVRTTLTTGTIPSSLSPGTWDVATRNAIRLALAVVLQHSFAGVPGGFASGEEAAASLNSMPTAQPPSPDRGTWFVLELAMRFPESSSDPVLQSLWSCARALRGGGTDGGARLSALTYDLARGTPAQAPAASAAVASSNSNVRELIAAAQQQVIDIEAPGGGAFVIQGRAPRPAGEIPWTPIVIGTGVVLLGASLAVAWSRGMIGSRRRGVRGLGWMIESQQPRPLRLAMEQSRW